MGKRDDKRLKKVINLEFIIFSLVAIAVTMVLSTFIFYEVYKAEIIRDLKGYAEVLKNTGDFDADDPGVYASVDTNDLRLTLIAPDGSVLYDNQADEISMQNHLDRPEIAEAFENGDGQVIRKSETLNKSTYYYAILLKSGRVLRIARETNNVISMFLAGHAGGDGDPGLCHHHSDTLSDQKHIETNRADGKQSGRRYPHSCVQGDAAIYRYDTEAACGYSEELTDETGVHGKCIT